MKSKAFLIILATKSRSFSGPLAAAMFDVTISLAQTLIISALMACLLSVRGLLLLFVHMLTSPLCTLNRLHWEEIGSESVLNGAVATKLTGIRRRA